MIHMKEVYLVLFTAIPFLCMFAVSLFIKRGGWLKGILMFTALGLGFAAGVHWPLRQVRIISDSEFIAQAPVTVVSITARDESPKVEVVLRNGKGEVECHTVNRETRTISFSKVPLPENIGF
jgi:hypothetical protein